jgi:hypothetical protein
MSEELFTYLKIKSDGTPQGTVIIGPDGKKIGMVQKIGIIIDADEATSQTVMYLKKVPLEFEGETLLITK